MNSEIKSCKLANDSKVEQYKSILEEINKFNMVCRGELIRMNIDNCNIKSRIAIQDINIRTLETFMNKRELLEKNLQVQKYMKSNKYKNLLEEIKNNPYYVSDDNESVNSNGDVYSEVISEDEALDMLGDNEDFESGFRSLSHCLYKKTGTVYKINY